MPPPVCVCVCVYVCVCARVCVCVCVCVCVAAVQCTEPTVHARIDCCEVSLLYIVVVVCVCTDGSKKSLRHKKKYRITPSPLMTIKWWRVRENATLQPFVCYAGAICTLRSTHEL